MSCSNKKHTSPGLWRYTRVSVPASLIAPPVVSIDRFPNQIWFVIGDATENKDEDQFYGVLTAFRTWSNLDNNAMLWIIEAKTQELFSAASYEWIFYMHDTCVVNPEFYEQTQAILNEQLALRSTLSAVRLYSSFSMSMGYYKLSALWEPDVKNYMIRTVNYDTSTQTKLYVKSCVEDMVFKYLEQTQRHVGCISQSYRASDPHTTLYGTNNPRIIEEWLPGFKKYKANWVTFSYLHL